MDAAETLRLLRPTLRTLIKEQVAVGIARLPSPKLRPATVETVDASGGTASVTVDGDSASITAQVISIVPTAGDRVMVQFVPPHGAVVVGEVGGFTANGGTPHTPWTSDRDAAGWDLDSVGHLGIGVAASAAHALTVSPSATVSDGSTLRRIDIGGATTFDTAAGGNFAGIHAGPAITHTANMTSIYGFNFAPTGLGAGTVTTVVGVRAGPNFGGGTVATMRGFWAQPTATLGTTTLAYGIDIASIQGFAGTITTMVGLRIAGLAGSTLWGLQILDYQSYHQGRLTVGAAVAPATSALIDMVSTTRAPILPRMTTAQRNAIVAPVDGMIIYNTTTLVIEGRENGAWVNL